MKESGDAVVNVMLPATLSIFDYSLAAEVRSYFSVLIRQSKKKFENKTFTSQSTNSFAHKSTSLQSRIDGKFSTPTLENARLSLASRLGNIDTLHLVG